MCVMDHHQKAGEQKVKLNIVLLSVCLNFASGEDGGFDELSTDSAPIGVIKYNMRKSLDLDQEGCYLQAGKKECLEECGFNATAKTIFIIHGWTVHKL